MIDRWSAIVPGEPVYQCALFPGRFGPKVRMTFSCSRSRLSKYFPNETQYNAVLALEVCASCTDQSGDTWSRIQ